MLRRISRIAFLAIVAFAAFVTTASAATSEQIHRDAADGSIDGTYTLAEMRAADRSVGAEQREYGGWDDVYGAYIRSLSRPNPTSAVVPAAPIDVNRNGKIDPREAATATKITRAKCTKATPAAKRSKVCKAVGVAPVAAEPTEAEEPREDTPAASSKRDGDGDGDGSPLLWLIAGIPLLVVVVGAWRARTHRPKGDPRR